jgi:hypothetical protein
VRGAGIAQQAMQQVCHFYSSRARKRQGELPSIHFRQLCANFAPTQIPANSWQQRDTFIATT